MTSVSPEVESAYTWCKEYTRNRARNFYYGFSILPDEKRNAIYAAYAFSGYVDDIADELHDRIAQTRQLAEARTQLRDCYAGRPLGTLFTALGDAVDRCAIPCEYFEELINGVEMDFTINRYATWDQLYQYCYRVAAMVGLICTSVFGTRPDPDAREAAVDMGIALQIVNIMRDVQEDAARNRVYFPADELAMHGLSADDILNGCSDERFTSLMRFQAERAWTYFERGHRLLPYLDLRSRMCVNVLQGIYVEILKRIEARNYDVLTERVGLTGREKLVSIGRLWAQAAVIRAA